MPLTEYQAKLGLLLSNNRSEDSYLAGGAAILAAPNSRRYSQDLDYFHDTAARVATAYESDHKTLAGHGYAVEPDILQPGYIRAIVRKGGEATKVEWAQDSTWRFMPVMRSEAFGFQLHPVDLATNKILALAGRDEPRDLVDTLYLNQYVLDLGPLVWAAAGKDPGFSPHSLLELLRRRGKIRPEDLERLDLTVELDVRQLKQEWLKALNDAENFVGTRPPDEVGCLYYSSETEGFVNPNSTDKSVVPHYGRPGGVLPKVAE
ncbi:MAG: hypothetical protein M3Y08_01895 [Fibrobacterota bacterium]|nr:hypothetical protein [Fibrobacterota bacterium]